MLHENYNSYTPTYAVMDFVKQYAKLLEMKKGLLQETTQSSAINRDEEYERLFAKLRDNLEGSQIQDKINVSTVPIEFAHPPNARLIRTALLETALMETRSIRHLT